MKMSLERAVQRFVDCSICAGYAVDTGRPEMQKEIVGDFPEIRDAILDFGAEGLTRLRDLAGHTRPPWVRYYAAAGLLDKDRSLSRKTLDDLAKCDGLVAVSALSLLGEFKH
jgi:hypothetical protein